MSVRDARNHSCLVVMYHYVHDTPPLVGSESIGPHAGVRGLSTAAFRDQLDHLCSVLEPIDWPTWFAAGENHASLPARSFLLTFDDGLADHANHVAPILEARGLRGTFFVPGSVLISPRLLPAHLIHLLLSRLGDAAFEQALRRSVAAQPDGARWIERLDDLERVPQPGSGASYHYESQGRAKLKTWLTFQLPVALRRCVLDQLFERHVGDQAPWARRWYVSREDISSMQARGHTIGGHGFSHEPLARLDRRAQEEDMIRCAHQLNEDLGFAARPCSYPYGSVQTETSEACRRAGFVQAFTTEARFADPRTDDPMRLPRLDTIDVAARLRVEEPCTTTP